MSWHHWGVKRGQRAPSGTVIFYSGQRLKPDEDESVSWRKGRSQSDLGQRRSICRWRVTAGLMICLSLSACADREKASRLAVYPVRGSVFVDGKPAERAQVTFHPVNISGLDRTQPYAIVGDDGSFEPSTYLSKDGAPAGEYALTIIWPTVTIEQGEEVSGPDRLKKRYATLESPVTRITVVEGENLLDRIDIKSQ